MADTKTRSITILKDNEKLFVLSEAALKRLNAPSSQIVPQKENELPHQHVHVNTDKANQEIAELKERNEQLWKIANGKLLTDTSRVQSSQVKFKHEKICVDYENKLNDCYMRNSGKPLLCANLAKEFWECVNSKKQISK